MNASDANDSTSGGHEDAWEVSRVCGVAGIGDSIAARVVHTHDDECLSVSLCTDSVLWLQSASSSATERAGPHATHRTTACVVRAMCWLSSYHLGLELRSSVVSVLHSVIAVTPSTDGATITRIFRAVCRVSACRPRHMCILGTAQPPWHAQPPRHRGSITISK